MTDLSAEIAVLDGLDDLYGSTMEMIPGGSYTKQVMPFVQSRNNVIDASEGGNYSGGSSYAPAGIFWPIAPARSRIWSWTATCRAPTRAFFRPAAT